MKYLAILILVILIPQKPLFFSQNGQATEYDDWVLPSKSELTAMYNALHSQGVGNFGSTRYWSSSEYDSERAGDYYFGFDMWVNNEPKTVGCNVRACRSFTASSGAYSLRDVGPAGGLIFYIDASTTYYEAAPSDQGTSKTWSNITTLASGATGTAIGTGQANTTAIVGQSGHTNSAAKLCDDLIIYN